MNPRVDSRPMPRRLLAALMGGLAVMIWFGPINVAGDAAPVLTTSTAAPVILRCEFSDRSFCSAGTNCRAYGSVVGLFRRVAPAIGRAVAYRAGPWRGVEAFVTTVIGSGNLKIHNTVRSEPTLGESSGDRQDSVDTERFVAWRHIALNAVPLLLVLFTSIAWSWSLRRQVAKRTEELRRSEESQRAMIACSPVALYSLDLADRVRTWNASAERVFGWTAEEVVGQPLPILPEDKQAEFRRLREELLAGPGFAGREVIRKKKDGTCIDASLSAAPIYGVRGDIIGIMGAIEDISHRKHAEERIGHLNRVLRAIRNVNQLIVREQNLDTLIREGCRLLVEQQSYKTALILMTDEHDRPQTWATAGMDAGCAPLEELLRNAELPSCCVAARDAMNPRLISDQNTICSACSVAGECAETDTLCVRLRHGGTSHGYLAVTVSRDLGVDDEEQGLLAEAAGDLAYALSAMRDRTARTHAEQARKDLQQQLLQAQKMEAVGQLAGGVAHDFNNILQAMMGHVQLLIDAALEKGERCEELHEIYRGAERAAALTRQLLSFSRRQVMQPRLLDMNAVVENFLKMLRRVIGEHIGLEWLPANQLGAVLADPAMMEQVLMNLCVNARDAMPHGGGLTIRTRNVQIDPAYCANRAFARPGSFVKISVTDTGCGMDETTLAHIFEPFFTTKETGKGTGLGLATVHGIVRQHVGWIEVSSQTDVGTDVSVFLPTQGSGAAALPEPTTEAAAKGGTETILLVEDESALRVLTRRFLEGRGYKIIEARSGREALRIWEERRDHVDLLMTDLVMPEGVSGRELSERLRLDKPSLKVILTSGYSPDVAGRDTVFSQRCKSQFLQKPYATRDLLKAIRQSLDEN